MTEINRKILEKELKRYKLLEQQKRSSYHSAKVVAIKQLLKILDEGYVEEKSKSCPFIKRGNFEWTQICEEEHCRCWSIKRKDCGLKKEI